MNCSKFIQETLYQISSDRPSFIEDITQKHFGLFFSGHTVLARHLAGGNDGDMQACNCNWSWPW